MRLERSCIASVRFEGAGYSTVMACSSLTVPRRRDFGFADELAVNDNPEVVRM